MNVAVAESVATARGELRARVKMVPSLANSFLKSAPSCGVLCASSLARRDTTPRLNRHSFPIAVMSCAATSNVTGAGEEVAPDSAAAMERISSSAPARTTHFQLRRGRLRLHSWHPRGETEVEVDASHPLLTKNAPLLLWVCGI